MLTEPAGRVVGVRAEDDVPGEVMAQAHKPRSPSNPAPVRVLIVDDHALARAGMRQLLRGARQVEVIGEAGDARDALSMCRRLRPDLVLMDVRLPDMDGLAATRAIRHAQPEIKVLLITMYEAREYASEAVRAGAAGYLLKGASRREVLAALHRALRSRSKPPTD
jgi:DNA-binding NarL/FixJ family response regulator